MKSTRSQAFNDANPEYWRLTHGHPPPPDDAARAFDAHPPADMSYREDLWFIVREQASGAITAQIAVATDLMAPGVYHLGFFIRHRLTDDQQPGAFICPQHRTRFMRQLVRAQATGAHFVQQLVEGFSRQSSRR